MPENDRTSKQDSLYVLKSGYPSSRNGVHGDAINVPKIPESDKLEFEGSSSHSSTILMGNSQHTTPSYTNQNQDMYIEEYAARLEEIKWQLTHVEENIIKERNHFQ